MYDTRGLSAQELDDFEPLRGLSDEANIQESVLQDHEYVVEVSDNNIGKLFKFFRQSTSYERGVTSRTMDGSLVCWFNSVE